MVYQKEGDTLKMEKMYKSSGPLGLKPPLR